jgi:hypothetical protein
MELQLQALDQPEFAADMKTAMLSVIQKTASSHEKRGGDQDLQNAKLFKDAGLLDAQQLQSLSVPEIAKRFVQTQLQLGGPVSTDLIVAPGQPLMKLTQRALYDQFLSEAIQQLPQEKQTQIQKIAQENFAQVPPLTEGQRRTLRMRAHGELHASKDHQDLVKKLDAIPSDIGNRIQAAMTVPSSGNLPSPVFQPKESFIKGAEGVITPKLSDKLEKVMAIIWSSDPLLDIAANQHDANNQWDRSILEQAARTLKAKGDTPAVEAIERLGLGISAN